MADAKTTALTENTTPLLTDLLYMVDDPGASPLSQKMTVETLLKLINVDGWIPAGETWAYASADDPTFTFTVSGVDLTTKYYAGMRLKLTQTSVKYFIVTKVEFSTNTTVTIYGGTDYDLADAAITLPYYSTAKAPAGFLLDPAKWTVATTDTNNINQATPVQNTWYNLGSVSISIPIGIWRVYYEALLQSARDVAGAVDVNATLSTANNSESDSQFTASFTGSNNTGGLVLVHKEKSLVITTKTTYYFNSRTTLADQTYILVRGDTIPTMIRAVCVYL